MKFIIQLFLDFIIYSFMKNNKFVLNWWKNKVFFFFFTTILAFKMKKKKKKKKKTNLFFIWFYCYIMMFDFIE